MIDAYRFGRIVIEKIPYDRDVLVFPDHVQADWWRKEGHALGLADIQGALEETRPRTLVVGTGRFGLMKVRQDVTDYLQRHDIRLYAEPTEKATKIFNRLLLASDDVVGAFHLTC